MTQAKSRGLIASSETEKLGLAISKWSEERLMTSTIYTIAGILTWRELSVVVLAEDSVMFAALCWSGELEMKSARLSARNEKYQGAFW